MVSLLFAAVKLARPTVRLASMPFMIALPWIVTPYFPRVKVRNDGRRPVNRLSGHTSLALRDAWMIVGRYTPYQG